MKIDYKTIRIIPQMLDVDSRVIQNVEVIKFEGHETQFTIFDKANLLVKNRFSPELRCKLTPIQVVVYDMLMGSEMARERGLANNGTLKVNQDSKEIFCANWPEEYNLLLDWICNEKTT
jgi:hypothetical protein